jgi:MFS family permease
MDCKTWRLTGGCCQISFTFILPLFPQLLEFYRDLEASNNSQNTLLAKTLSTLNAYKNAFSKPINSRYDIVLLGGALGSLFSLCQAIASPIIGRLSDKHGRRTALLYSMLGNIASVALWVAAVDFRTFLASRVVGGLSEGNVQLATAIATDVSSDEKRGATMALVGACFSIAFTVGPALGAWLSSITSVANNPFATAAGFSLFLVVSETLYLWVALPETLPAKEEKVETTMNGHANGHANGQANGHANGHANGYANGHANGQSNGHANGHAKQSSVEKQNAIAPAEVQRTNPRWLLNGTHFLFVLCFSGMEFSLPFMTYDLFQYTPSQSGRLLGFMGLIASVLQGGVVRRMHPLNVVQLGVVSCAGALFMLGNLTTTRGLYMAATLLAVTSGTVVTGLNSLSSFEAAKAERGSTLGNHRSWGKFWHRYAVQRYRLIYLLGQVGRALGPLIFCTLYWWAGRQVAYLIGGTGMLAVCGLVFGALKKPAGTENLYKKKKVA